MIEAADGSQAQFRENQLIIRSPAGEEIETFQASALLVDDTLASTKRHRGLSQEQVLNVNLEDFTKTSHPLLAQSNLDCQTQVVRSLARISTSITRYTDSMANSQSSITQMARWALSYSAKALENSTLPEQENIQDISCRPPVQCDQQQISGGSEIRTDLFALAPGASHGDLILEYEFYTIPDTLEMYYNGQRIFSTGEVSGQSRRTFSIPASAQEIGITIIGNRNTNTRWWYKISCAQIATAPPNQQDTSQESDTEEDCQEITSEVARLNRSLEALDKAKENYEDLQAKLAIENYDLSRITESLNNTKDQLESMENEINELQTSIPDDRYRDWLEERQREQHIDWTSSFSLQDHVDNLISRGCDLIPDWGDIIPVFYEIGDIAPGYTDHPLLSFSISSVINPLNLVTLNTINLACLGDEIKKNNSASERRTYERYYEDTQPRIDFLRSKIRMLAERLLFDSSSIDAIYKERQSTSEEIFQIVNRDLYGNTDDHINSILESGRAPNPEQMLNMLRELDNWRQENISRLDELKNSPCWRGS